MDYALMNSKALRAACKVARISYGSLDTAGMRAALEAHAAQVLEAHAAQDTSTEGVLDASTLQPLDAAPQQPAAVQQPAAKGIKIEKDRVLRNGVKRPSAGGLCRAVWDWCDAQLAQGSNPSSKGVKAHAAEVGWNVNNATIELYQWRKWSKRTPEELAALAAPLVDGPVAQSEADGAAPQQDAANAA